MLLLTLALVQLCQADMAELMDRLYHRTPVGVSPSVIAPLPQSVSTDAALLQWRPAFNTNDDGCAPFAAVNEFGDFSLGWLDDGDQCWANTGKTQIYARRGKHPSGAQALAYVWYRPIEYQFDVGTPRGIDSPALSTAVVWLSDRQLPYAIAYWTQSSPKSRWQHVKYEKTVNPSNPTRISILKSDAKWSFGTKNDDTDVQTLAIWDSVPKRAQDSLLQHFKLPIGDDIVFAGMMTDSYIPEDKCC